MKKILVTILMAGFISLTLAYALDSKMPGPDAKELWNYITKESPYTQWGFWEDHKDMQPGKAPHGPFHKVYVNEILLNATAVPVPYGSIQVKENFNAAKKKVAITAMYKVKDFDPEHGDWFWARYTLNGTAGPSGKVQMCIGCHAVKADNDYIIVHKIK